MRFEAQAQLVLDSAEDGASIFAGGGGYVEAEETAFANGGVVPLQGKIVEAGESGAVDDGAAESRREKLRHAGEFSALQTDGVTGDAHVRGTGLLRTELGSSFCEEI